MRVPSSVHSSEPASMLTRSSLTCTKPVAPAGDDERDRALGDVVDHRRPLRRPGAVLHRDALGEGGAIDGAEARLQLGLERRGTHDALDRRLVLRRRRRLAELDVAGEARGAQAGDAGLAVGVERARPDPPRRRAGVGGGQIELHVVLRREPLHRLPVGARSRRRRPGWRAAAPARWRRRRRARPPRRPASPAAASGRRRPCRGSCRAIASTRGRWRPGRPRRPAPSRAARSGSTTSAAASSVTTAPSAVMSCGPRRIFTLRSKRM